MYSVPHFVLVRGMRTLLRHNQINSSPGHAVTQNQNISSRGLVGNWALPGGAWGGKLWERGVRARLVSPDEGHLATTRLKGQTD